MKKLFHLTQEGVDELKKEHVNLVAQRGTIADNIKTAREFGDLSENAEYQSARQDQEHNEGRIAEIEHILSSVEVIQTSSSNGKVQLGQRVKLKSENGKSKEFQVVGTVEADPLEGKISDESPLGKAVLGKKQGDEVEIITPVEKVTYKIVEIL